MFRALPRPPDNPMKYIFLLCALVFFCPIAKAGAAASPLAAVRNVQRAIETMDLDLASASLDSNALIQSAVAEALAHPELLRQAGENPVMALILAGYNSGPEAREAVQTMLATEIHNFFAYGIRSGAFAGKLGAGANPGDPGLFGTVFRGNERDIKRLSEARLLEEKGNTARVSATLYDGMSKKSYPLELGLVRESGVWRIKELRNLKALLPPGGAR